MVLCVLVAVALGTLVVVSPAADRVRSGLRGAVDGLVTRVGALPAAAILLVGGLGATLGVGYPLGRLAAALETSVDWPVYGYFVVRMHPGWWTDLNDTLTLMGNRPQIKVACLVGGIALALVWPRRGWYIPPLVVALTFVAEKYTQKFLAVTVNRGHPPTTHGTYPSGGVARLITVYGIILFLALLAAPSLSRHWRVALWVILAGAAGVEAYTRVYLLKHWVTDVVASLVFGPMVLVTMMGFTIALMAFRDRRGRVRAAGSASNVGEASARAGEAVAG